MTVVPRVGSLYLLQSRSTGKGYVGITTKDPQQRFREHQIDAAKGSQLPFHKALRKYGSLDFELIVLSSGVPWRELCFLECATISEKKTKVPYGYNVADGGEGIVGVPWSEERRKKIVSARIGMRFTLEHRQNLSLAHRGAPGRVWTLEQRAKLAASAKKSANTPEQRTMRSERAKRQHAEGKFGRATWKNRGLSE